MPFVAKAPKDDVMATRLHAFDEVNDFAGWVLQVVINGDDVITTTVCQSTKNGVVLAVVTEQIDGDHVRLAGSFCSNYSPALITATVVDENDFVAEIMLLKERRRLFDDHGHDTCAVVDRDHDRKLRRRLHTHVFLVWLNRA